MGQITATQNLVATKVVRHAGQQAEEIEKIQRRATKRVAVLHDLPYEERLKALKLPTLVYRRLRGDLVNVYKYMNNLYDVKSIISEDKDDTRRGHSAKLEKLGCKKRYKTVLLQQQSGCMVEQDPPRSHRRAIYRLIQEPSRQSFQGPSNDIWLSRIRQSC